MRFGYLHGPTQLGTYLALSKKKEVCNVRLTLWVTEIFDIWYDREIRKN